MKDEIAATTTKKIANEKKRATTTTISSLCCCMENREKKVREMKKKNNAVFMHRDMLWQQSTERKMLESNKCIVWISLSRLSMAQSTKQKMSKA